MILTKEQKEKYIASGAQHCPFCESSDISGGRFDAESMECWQEVSCDNCGNEWQDVYKLAFVETQDELNSK